MQPKIILISGPTASGKSKLAIDIAKKFKGEVVNADSMQVYKEIKILSFSYFKVFCSIKIQVCIKKPNSVLK